MLLKKRNRKKNPVRMNIYMALHSWTGFHLHYFIVILSHEQHF